MPRARHSGAGCRRGGLTERFLAAAGAAAIAVLALRIAKNRLGRLEIMAA